MIHKEYLRNWRISTRASSGRPIDQPARGVDQGAVLTDHILLMHGLSRELKMACEAICDNAVITGRDAISDSEISLEVATLIVEARRVDLSLGIIGGPGRLARRIAGMLNSRRNTMTRTNCKTTCIVTFAFIAGIMVVSAVRFAAANNAAKGPEAIASPAPALTMPVARKSPTSSQAAPVAAVDPNRAIVLRGRVFGPGDRPIAGARLYLNIDERTESTELGMSDADGGYRLVVSAATLTRTVSPNFGVADSNAALLVTMAGFGPGWAALESLKGGRMGEMKPEYAQDFHLEADYPIAGRIVDAAGNPIAGAGVSVLGLYNLADRRWYKMGAAIEAGDPNLMSREESDPTRWYAPLYPTAWGVIPPATTDPEGRFQLAGVGRNRAVRLAVAGPGIRADLVSVLTRDDATDFTEALRRKYPRQRRPLGLFYPPRKDAPEGDQGIRLFGPSPTIEVDPARTISGVVRDAGTGEPIVNYRMRVASESGYASAQTDRHGRYHITRDGDNSSIVMFSDYHQTDRYLITSRQLNDVGGFGDTVANFDIPRGVVINGRVLESGTDRPIVSAPRQGCHDTVPGPLLAGNVSWFPLASNTALRGSPTGLYFEGIPAGSQNLFLSAAIDGDGRFHMAIPPGPGVLLVRASPGLPMMAQFQIWQESNGYHRLFPYAKLKTRTKDDGAPAGDAANLAGFINPIPLSGYEAYQVINPAAAATDLEVTISVPRAPSRTLRFVDPEGQAIRGVQVEGLVAPSLTIILDGSEAEVLALEPGQPRQVTASTIDGKFSASVFVSTDDPQPRTVRLDRKPPDFGPRLESPSAF